MAQFLVTIDSTKVLADLTDFPVYIDLADMPADFWSTVSNGGGDIRVYKEDGITELPREVVSCDTATKKGELHLKYTGTLSGSVDTKIVVDVDGSRSDYAVTDTYGRNNVWTGYDMVLHMNAAIDSTGKQSVTNVSSLSLNADCKLGECATNNGSVKYLEVAHSTSINYTTNLYMSVWVAPSQLTPYRNPILYKDNTWGSAPGYCFYFSPGGSNAQLITNRPNTAYQSLVLADDLILDSEIDVFTYINVVKTASVGVHVFKNGGSFKNNTGSFFANNYGSSTNVLRTPMRYETSDRWRGKFEELRLSSALKDANWIATEYNNQSTPSGFYTITVVPTNLRVPAQNRVLIP